MLRLVSYPAAVLFFLCPVYAQQNAVLHSNGAVKVNGSPAGYSTVVMEGDRIETDKHSSASLLLPGRMISLGSASSVVYHDGSVVPSTGVAKVVTSSCRNSSCTTSSALLGYGSAKVSHDDNGDKDNNQAKDDKDKDKDHPKKKCISPKKPHKDKDCDDDDDDHGNGNGNGNGEGNGH